MRIPSSASPDVQSAFRELHERLDRFGADHAPNVNLKGNRFSNGGDAVQDNDFVTLRQLLQALGETATITAASVAAAVDGTSDSGSGTGTDDGLGAEGCAACGSDGHPTVTTLTAYAAGTVVCGTGNEFPALLLATVDQATKDANSTELVRRMIWHLNLAGFTAGRQRNPSGVLSTNKLTVNIEGTIRAYDVIVSGANYLVDGSAGMSQVFPADYVADAGIAD